MTKILVIEDEAQTRNIFMKCLAFEGFCAIEAEQGTIGIKLAQSHLPDLIVCDIMLPDIDGYGVLSAIRQHRPTAAIPFIFLTAKVTMADLRQGMALGSDDYLTKPCTVEQFLAAIAMRLQRQALLREHFSAPSANLDARRSHPAVSSDPSSDIFPHCPRLAQMFTFIEANYWQPIGLGDVAEAAGYSPAYLTNLAQDLTGYSVKRWITERRMFQARQLLRDTTQSIKQVAEAVGYADVGYFTRQFRQLHGEPPQIWRNSTRLLSA
ncbi:DNA-binding response regulator [Leptolyngbya sp. 'hensonii']|uniref:response regulator transcription factor n=1 Tax=Leptolyngbya sp. 'hensonii' TaxID=1922337 RepID=UPI00094F513F|nr:helix-turn-helix domain-containing protein [Leptolyngbya sp. 'hensonii']OLP18138.1 DNA-binding response regulator [Leptolyngbya sp. 'hensonii']